MKRLYELGPDSEVAEPADVPTVPSNVSAFANDAGYVRRYALLAADVEYSGATASAALRDRAVNGVDLSGHASTAALSLSFPEASSGYARDFFVRLTVDALAASAPTITFYDPATQADITLSDIPFGASSLADIAPGDNLILFTEVEANKWLVSVKHEEAAS